MGIVELVTDVWLYYLYSLCVGQFVCSSSGRIPTTMSIIFLCFYVNYVYSVNSVKAASCSHLKSMLLLTVHTAVTYSSFSWKAAFEWMSIYKQIRNSQVIHLNNFKRNTAHIKMYLSLSFELDIVE